MESEIIKKARQGKASHEKINLLREGLHHLLLQEVDRKGGFQALCFVGGTAVRLLYQLDRFSEDLDFSTTPNRQPPFQLERLVAAVSRSLKSFGLEVEVANLRTTRNVQSCFFRFSNLLHKVDPVFRATQKLAIKFEVDTRPPEGAQDTVSPVVGGHLYKIRHYDLPSLFAGKLHAVLCREYTKGRDLYDFLWYVGKRTPVNFGFLENALFQTEGKKIHTTLKSLQEALVRRFERVNFEEARKDVDRFLVDPRSVSLFELPVFLEAIKRIPNDSSTPGGRVQ